MAHPSKTVLVSGGGVALMEAAARLPLEHAVTFGIQTTIGVLTVVYLLVKIYNSLKKKEA